MSRSNLNIRISGKPESSSPLSTVYDAAFTRLNGSMMYNLLIIVSFLLSIGESILVGFGIDGIIFKLQIAFLAAATGFFVIVTFMQLRYLILEDDIGEVRRPVLIASLFGPEIIFEIACFAFGWATLFVRPGLAALRCVRVFRYLFYSHLYGIDNKSGALDTGYFFGLRQSLLWATVYLERIATELFSSNSLGGLVVVSIFFYLSYLFAVIFWVEKNDLVIEGSQYGNDCHTLNNCFITILRLAFFDTLGLDYLQAMMNSGARGYTFLLLLYVVIAAMILLNGLIGIFSRVFAPIKFASGSTGAGPLTRQASQKSGNVDRLSIAPRSITGNGGGNAVTSPYSSTPNHNAPIDHAEVADLVNTVELLRLEILGLNGKITHIHDMLKSRLVVGPLNNSTSFYNSPAKREQRERQKATPTERNADRAVFMAKRLSSFASFTFSGPDGDEEGDSKRKRVQHDHKLELDIEEISEVDLKADSAEVGVGDVQEQAPQSISENDS